MLASVAHVSCGAGHARCSAQSRRGFSVSADDCVSSEAAASCTPRETTGSSLKAEVCSRVSRRRTDRQQGTSLAQRTRVYVLTDAVTGFSGNQAVEILEVPAAV